MVVPKKSLGTTELEDTKDVLQIAKKRKYMNTLEKF
jgi:hypothetical protein